jgi:two-component system NtrC family response regulator
MQHSILVVDDNLDNLNFLRSVLKPEGYNVFPADNVETGASYIKKNKGKLSLALVDHHMPGMTGDKAIAMYKSIDPDLQFLSITGDPTDDVFRANVEAGAFMVLQRNMNLESLYSVIRSYCSKFEEQSRVIENQLTTLGENEVFIQTFGMVGRSNHLRGVCELIENYGKTELAVLIHGENGTGKERVARAIHAHSRVSEGPFVAVNCAAINEGVIESELFGHLRGAFTGANRDRKGYFLEANGGTLFLDEIGDMPIHLQSKLLRAIQEKEIVPVGSAKPVRIETRVIAATNVNLKEAIDKHRFREDLFYRLNVLPISLCPLRERKEDIEPLALAFAKKWARQTGQVKEFRARAMSALRGYEWPGNIRELENVVTRTLAKTEGAIIELAHLDENLQRLAVADDENEESYVAIKARHEKEEREFLTKAIKKSGSLSAAARLLNLGKSTLHGRVKSLGIKI